jgi:DNA-binding MarR family transcriptional regulator
MASPASNLSDDPLPVRLATGLAKIGLALKSRSWRDAAGRGLTPTQGQILTLLRRGPLRLAALAEELGVTPATASDAVSALKRKGLVKKPRTKHDARAISVELTARGRREADRAAQWPDFLAAVAGELSPGEQAVLLRALIKMIRTLQLRGEIPVARMCVTCRFFRPNACPGAAQPHYCDFVSAPFGDSSLRLDCPDHAPAPPGLAETNWQSYLGKESTL